MNITVHTRTPEQLADIEEMLRGIAGGVEYAQTKAVNDAITHLKTQTSRLIREKYDIKKSVLDSRYLKMKPRLATGGVPIASLVISGEQIPLAKFNGAWPARPTPLDYFVSAHVKGRDNVRVRPSVQARGHQFLGTSAPLLEKDGMKAFVARMPVSGHIGIFARDGGRSREDSDAIKELFGSSAAKMVENPDVANALSTDATEWYEKRLSHYVTALLTGSLRRAGSGRGRRR